MTDELVKRLRSMHWCVTTETNGVGVSDRKVALEAADRIEQLVATNKQLTAERDRLALAICGGEDAPGYANAQTVETLEYALKQNRQSHWATINSLLAAEAERDRLREALIELIQQTHNCERELTEDLHHVDFCGESAPLTNARAALKGESHE